MPLPEALAASSEAKVCQRQVREGKWQVVPLQQRQKKAREMGIDERRLMILAAAGQG